jgi:MFS family permease
MTTTKVIDGDGSGNAGAARLGNNFHKLFFAAMFSCLADGISVVVFPLLAKSFGASVFEMGIIAAFRTLPWLLFSLPVGALVDRWNLKVIMMVSNLIRTGLCLVLVGLLLFNAINIHVLMAVAAVVGLLEVFFDTSNQTFVPRIVQKEKLTSANSRQQSAELLMNKLIGAPVGGFLAIYSFPLAFSILAVCFLAPSILVGLISHSGRLDNGGAPVTRDPILKSVKEGMQYVLQHKVLRLLALNTGFVNISLQAVNAVFVLFVIEEIKAPDWAFGFLTTAAAAGGLLGATIIGRAKARYGVAACLRGVIILLPVSILITPLFMSIWMVAFAQFLLGINLTSWAVLAISYRQTVVPPHLMGRANSFYRLMAWGSLPIGSLLGGAVAGHFGFTTLYFIFGGVLVLPIFLLPLITQKRMDDA